MCCDDCLSVAQITGHLIVPFVTINNTVIVDDPLNDIEYIKTNRITLGWTLAIGVKQEVGDSEPLCFELLDSSENNIRADELDDMEEDEEKEEGEEEEEKAGKVELPVMLEDNSKLGIMPITSNEWMRNSPSHTGKLERQDFEIQYTEELDLVDTTCNNIASMELDGAKDPNEQAQKEDQLYNADVDWWVTVHVRTVELQSELSCIQSYYQHRRQCSAAVRAAVRAQPLSAVVRATVSCCQSSAPVRAAVRAADRTAVRATVRATVRAQPLSEY